MTIAGEKIKESIEVYEEGNNKHLLRIIRDLKKFVNTYDLFTELSEASVYPKDTWNVLIVSETLSETNFDIHLVDLVTNELETEAFKYQVKHLRKTKKSGNH